MKFRISKTASQSKARSGIIETARGNIETPVFMPVGTRGTVKAITHQQLEDIGTQIIVNNTYHLMLRPGIEIIERAGGLHRFINWPHPILTDSGGFQIFSLASLSKVTEDGVSFKSHIDGKMYYLGPHESMQIQKALGSDIVMAFDQCTPYPCERDVMEQSLNRTHLWAAKCREFPLGTHQSLFGIVQGGVYADCRKESAQVLAGLDFDGYAIGGLFGVHDQEKYQAIEDTEPFLPWDKPRYLMGTGTPRELVEAVMRGIDMFDCVLPTRDARTGTAFTWAGKISIDSGKYADDFSPMDPEIDAYSSRFSKAYIRHLLNVDEITGLTLVTMHNLAFYLDFMRQLRQSIEKDTLPAFYERVCAIYPIND